MLSSLAISFIAPQYGHLSVPDAGSKAMSAPHPAHVKRYYPSLLTVAQRLGRRWDKAAGDSAMIDLQSDLMRYTVDTIAGLAFGSAVNTLETDDDVIQRHLDHIFPAIARRILPQRVLDYVLDRASDQ